MSCFFRGISSRARVSNPSTIIHALATSLHIVPTPVAVPITSISCARALGFASGFDRFGWWRSFLFCGLAIIGIGMIITIAIVPSHTIFIWWGVPQVQVAICLVISVGLAICRATEPPSRTICSPPCLLSCIDRVHCVFRASTTTILRLSNINDPMWTAQW
jgi:hypothetical protein